MTDNHANPRDGPHSQDKDTKTQRARVRRVSASEGSGRPAEGREGHTLPLGATAGGPRGQHSRPISCFCAGHTTQGSGPELAFTPASPCCPRAASQSVLLCQSPLAQRAGHGSQTHSQTVSEHSHQVPLHWRDRRELTHTPLPFRQEHSELPGRERSRGWGRAGHGPTHRAVPEGPAS